MRPLNEQFSSSIIVDATGRTLRQFKPDDVMKDGEYLCVPSAKFTMVFNSKGQAVRLGDAAMKAIAGPTFDAAAHRPGYRTGDTATVERNHGARAVYLHQLGDAWRSAQ